MEGVLDDDAIDFLRDVRAGVKDRPITVAMISERAAEEIKNLKGKEIYGNREFLGSNSVRHIDIRHGINGVADQSMADDTDLARTEYVLNNYDMVRFHGDYADGYIDKYGKRVTYCSF